MKFIKQYWYILFILIFTVGLGVMVLLTSQKLTTTQPVAPTVPQATPKAAEPACTLTFTIATSTPTPTPTPGPTATPTPTPTPGPTATPTPTPTPRVGCNNNCSVNADCASGLTCVNGACRNPSCTEETDCQCAVAAAPTPTPTAAPTPKIPVAGTGPSVLGVSVIGGGLLLLLLGLAL